MRKVGGGGEGTHAEGAGWGSGGGLMRKAGGGGGVEVMLHGEEEGERISVTILVCTDRA